jgi:hypothetical protein
MAISWKSLIFYSFLGWLGVVIYMSTPQRWTSVKRVVCETAYRLGMPFIVFNPYASIDGTLPYCDPEELLPIEYPPPVVFLGQGEDVETAIKTLKYAAENRDSIVVWKNFLKGQLDQYRNKQFIKENFNNDTYYFLTNYTNWNLRELGFLDALDILDELYLGFSYTVLDRNPVLWKDVNTVLSTYGDELQKIIPVNFSKHHAFVYEGTGYHTGMHQAPLSDWFLQVANTKRWTFFEPKYTPYLRTITEDGVSSVCAWDFKPERTKVPFVHVYTEPGDLMYFPPHWWHEVHNMNNEFGLAFGFRPKVDAIRAPLEILMPWRLRPGELGHRLLFFVSFLKNALAAVTNTNNADSGLLSRQTKVCNTAANIRKYIPNWNWDKFAPPDSPICPNVVVTPEESANREARLAAKLAQAESSKPQPVSTDSVNIESYSQEL